MRLPSILRCNLRQSTCQSVASARNLFSTEPDVDVVCQDPGIYDVVVPDLSKWGTAHFAPYVVPDHIQRPPYVLESAGRSDVNPDNFREEYNGDGRIPLGGDEERKLRNAAKVARRALRYIQPFVVPGVTTAALDKLILEYALRQRVYPSPLLYAGYPRASCTSVNNIIAHGIPDERKLVDGDIVNVDVTMYVNGYHGDTSLTFPVGHIDDIGRKLIDITTHAVEAAIEACGPGKPFKGIAHAIHQALAGKPYSVSRLFTGHGIGTAFHRPPWIIHDLNDEPEVMLPGHCFTIEPCIVQGTDASGFIFPDDWTVSTTTGARSAQAEHMVLITEKGADVLTRDE